MWQYNHTQQNELMHYGKKGMRWGKRSGPKPSGGLKVHISTPFSKDVKGKSIATKLGNTSLNISRKGRLVQVKGIGNEVLTELGQSLDSKKQKKGKSATDNLMVRMGATKMTKILTI